ncbi:MAG: nucleotide exchange factor GrpE [Desulfobulbaceae bacterium]|nr:nucleotide exchange factor GrpE [Desulfobulbaceae bacterium]
MSEEVKKQNSNVDEDAAQFDDTVEENGSEETRGGSEEPDVQQLQQQLDEKRDQLLRLAAEFENFKKRMEREREILVKYAGENIFRELLTTVDNLDRALEQGTADSGDDGQRLAALLEGVELTQKGLLSTLEKFEVVPLESAGKQFDPNEHEAMVMEASDKVPASHVLQEFAKGYRFKDRLLRPAKVVVSRGKE